MKREIFAMNFEICYNGANLRSFYLRAIAL